jgi:peptidoglycan hydrolase-like protein with peptidoglycan-binding domain
MKRILLASAACLALSLPAMAATAGAQPKPAPQNQQQSMAKQPAQNTNMQSSQANQASQPGNKQQAQLIRPSSLSKEQVREIQTKLNKDGFSSGHVDGIWGRDTDQAILDFQKAKKLPGHGELNQQTIADLGVKLNTRSEPTASSSKGQTATTSNHAGSMNNKAGSNPSNTKP